MKHKFLFTMLIPLALSSSTFILSCNSNPIINTKMRKDFVNPDYFAIAPVITATEFNKTFSHGDIIKMSINCENKDYILYLPYVTEYAEAGYYGSCLCDESDGANTGKSEKDYVNVSFAMHPYSKLASEKKFHNCDVKFEMAKKAGFKEKMDAVNCTDKLKLEDLGYDVLAYANFRDVNNVGNLNRIIKPNVMYRGASPINSGTTGSDRYVKANSILESYDIELDICLNKKYGTYCDTDITKCSGTGKEIYNLRHPVDKDKNPLPPINTYICENKYRPAKYNDWNKDIVESDELDSFMCCVPLNTDFYSSSDIKSQNYLYMCGKVFANIADDGGKSGPLSKTNNFYIHCEEGKDRTGFICAALEAFATPFGPSSNDYLDDIVADFMLSYKNYFNITLSQDINRYQEIADLTIYRHLYGLCLEDASKTFKDENFNWLIVNSKQKVKELLSDEENHNLNYYASRYVLRALTEFYRIEGRAEPEIDANLACISIRNKLCY